MDNNQMGIVIANSLSLHMPGEEGRSERSGAGSRVEDPELVSRKAKRMGTK